MAPLLNGLIVFSEEAAQKKDQGLFKLEAEILEVEELREPQGSAIYTVKDLSNGKTLQLFADPYRSVVHVGGVLTQVADVLGGGKATIVCRNTSEHNRPEIVFAKITSSYYS